MDVVDTSGSATSVRTIDEALRRRVEVLPDAEFVRVGSGGWLTATDLDRRAADLAAGLQKLGITVGDRIATILPNRIEVVELIFAIAKAGAVQVPLNYWLKGEFLRHQLEDCGARVLIADSAGLAAAAPLLETTQIEVVVAVDDVDGIDGGPATMTYRELSATTAQPDRIHPSTASTLAAILYTSGTTGLPKGCMLGNGYYTSSGRSYGRCDWVRAGDRTFTSFPLFHTSGQLNALFPALLNDASVHFETEFHASTYMDSARRAGATVLLGVGFMGQAILAQPPRSDDGEPGFRLAVWIPLTVDRQHEFERRFATPVLTEGYGQTEVVPVTASTVGGPRKRTSAGAIVPTVEVRIADADGNEVADGEVGEILVRPRQPDVMFDGYWQNSQATTHTWRGLWHHTGDAGYKDADNFVTFVDRTKDAVRRRGENVSSYQLEVAIAEHPAVAAVAVTAVASTLGDDDIKASIVAGDDGPPVITELFEFLKNTVPYYAIPRYIDIRPTLPTNAIGRVMKQVLRDEGVTATMIDFEALGLAVPREQRRGPANRVSDAE